MVSQSGVWTFLRSLPSRQSNDESAAFKKAQLSSLTLALRLVRVLVTASSGHDDVTRDEFVCEAEDFVVSLYKRYIDDRLIHGLERAVSSTTQIKSSDHDPDVDELESLSDAMAAVETVALGAISLPFMPFKSLSSDIVGDLVGVLHTAAKGFRKELWRSVARQNDGRAAHTTTVPVGVAALGGKSADTAAAAGRTVFSGFGGDAAASSSGAATTWTDVEASVCHNLLVIMYTTASALRALGQKAQEIVAAGGSGTAPAAASAASALLRNTDLCRTADAFVTVGQSAIEATAAEAAAGPSANPGVLDDIGGLLENAAGDVLLFLEHSLCGMLPVRPEEAARLGHKLQAAEEFASDTDIYRAVRRIQDLLQDA
jgi:hypothetical protein